MGLRGRDEKGFEFHAAHTEIMTVRDGVVGQ